MHKENKKHLQCEAFSRFPETVSELREMLKGTSEYYFYENVFCHIDETLFEPLYCKNNGRPNAPINVMVSALLLKEKRNWSFSEMFHEINFNVAVRYALGMVTFYGMPFSESTIFNFQNLISRYHSETGINLFEKVFEIITLSQIKRYRIKTDIARTDSFMLDSNIRQNSRLQLLIEVLRRLSKMLKKAGDTRFKEYLRPYTKKTSEHYLYELKSSEIPQEMEKVAFVYFILKNGLSVADYGTTREYLNFIRVFEEHFVVKEEKLEIRSQDELGSGILQSPDDEDATFRTKRGKSYRGQSGVVVETANPENEFNLLSDISLVANNVDDSDALNRRLEGIKDKMNDLKEIHQDGGFGSKDNDEMMDKLGITPIQTAIKGRKSETSIDIEQESDKSSYYSVSCMNGQRVKSTKTTKRNKAIFIANICDKCPFQDRCRTKKLRNGDRVFYFDNADYLKRKRHKSLESIPKERRNLRANVEATIHEFTYNLQGHKLKVRGAFKAELYLFSMAIMINFGRIYRYLQENPKKGDNFHFLLLFLINYLALRQILCKFTHSASKKKIS